MPTLNKVILLGNLTRDPELRHTPQGTAVCALGLAVNRRFTTAAGEGRDETCFVDVDVWGRQAQSCASYLRKGSPALVDGRLRMDQWDDRETGKRRTRLRVCADRVQFVGPPTTGDFAAGVESSGRGGEPWRGAAGAAPRQTSQSVTPRAEAEPAPMPAFEPLPADESGAPDAIPF
jgi:single-strand DNA-binding protein